LGTDKHVKGIRKRDQGSISKKVVSIRCFFALNANRSS
jgi:hypothetical protein